MAAAQVQVQHSISTEPELKSRLASKGLKVVEVYSNWCGPCKSVLPTFKKIRVDKDDEAALLFLTVPSESCSSMDLLKEHQGKSEPLFLLYRNGQLKGKVQGADVPSLTSLIYEFTPANAEIDDLEENPIYLASKADAAGKGASGKDAGKGGRKK